MLGEAKVIHRFLTVGNVGASKAHIMQGSALCVCVCVCARVRACVCVMPFPCGIKGII